jgi:hypothetical protein
MEARGGRIKVVVVEVVKWKEMRAALNGLEEMLLV